jgi:hypothetical protein
VCVLSGNLPGKRAPPLMPEARPPLVKSLPPPTPPDPTPALADMLDCGGQKWSLSEAQARGVDVGTTVAPSPATPQLLAMLKDFMVRNLL